MAVSGTKWVENKVVTGDSTLLLPRESRGNSQTIITSGERNVYNIAAGVSKRYVYGPVAIADP